MVGPDLITNILKRRDTEKTDTQRGKTEKSSSHGSSSPSYISKQVLAHRGISSHLNSGTPQAGVWKGNARDREELTHMLRSGKGGINPSK